MAFAIWNRISTGASALGLFALACGAPRTSAPLAKAPELPSEQARCQIAASQENPLVTEWPASEKANLETRLREGSVVVSYSGCSLKLLPSCRAKGGYVWRRTTTATDVIEIRNADDLYAKMPLGAVSLEGELERSGRLAVQTTVSGQLLLSDFDALGLKNDAACEGATHVVGALSVGAFKLRSGGAARTSGGASIAGIGSGHASSSSEENIVREAGVPARCELANDSAPDAQCASPVQIFLRPLPSTVVDRGPQGTMKVRFYPVRPEEPWDVMVGDRKICRAPCERWLDPGMPYTLKHDPGFWHRNEYIDVPDLRQYGGHERMEVRAIPRHTGEFVSGLVLTSLGGAAAVTGTALTAVGCASNNSGLCTAGLITLPLGLAGAAPGVYMIVDSAGEVNINPLSANAPPLEPR